MHICCEEGPNNLAGWPCATVHIATFLLFLSNAILLLLLILDSFIRKLRSLSFSWGRILLRRPEGQVRSVGGKGRREMHPGGTWPTNSPEPRVGHGAWVVRDGQVAMALQGYQNQWRKESYPPSKGYLELYKFYHKYAQDCLVWELDMFPGILQRST